MYGANGQHKTVSYLSFGLVLPFPPPILTSHPQPPPPNIFFNVEESLSRASTPSALRQEVLHSPENAYKHQIR